MPREAIRSPSVDRLFEAILALETLEECYAFFDDLCTVPEIKSMAQRFEVARLLAAGATYADVARKTGASTATVGRVKRFLHYGSNGYKLVLDRMGGAGLQLGAGRTRKQGT